MKQKRVLSWFWIGLTVVVLIWLGIKAADLIGHLVHVEGPRGFGRGQGFGYGGPHRLVSHHGYGVFGMSAVFAMLMKVSLLALFAVIWAKASGLLKWGGAALTGVVLMSLLTPFWGLAVMIVLFLTKGRMNRLKHDYGNLSGTPTGTYPVYDVSGFYTPSAYERGRMLDEWEKSNHKEEKQ